MGHGGKRPNSGPKKGAPKAPLAKALARKHAIATAEEILGDGLTPLRFMIDTMRDETVDRKLRLAACQDAAKYCHSAKPTEVILQAEVHIDGVEIEIVGKQ